MLFQLRILFLSIDSLLTLPKLLSLHHLLKENLIPFIHPTLHLFKKLFDDFLNCQKACIVHVLLEKLTEFVLCFLVSTKEEGNREIYSFVFYT